jgi:Major Facilitator Superfamily
VRHRDRALAPLRGRDFRLLFAARIVSFLGSAMAPVALAFAILDLTGSAIDLGFVLAARVLPAVVFMLGGGVVADRLPRHRVMVASNVVSGASQGAMALLLLSGRAEIWQLAVLAAVNGGSSAFFFPASQGIVPQTVPEELRQEGNALLRLGINASGISGAALGGLIVAATSPGFAIAIDAATFFVAAVLTARMRIVAALVERSSFLAELREGWSEFSARTWLWVIVIQFAFVNAVEQGAEGVLGPTVAKEHLHGPEGWGIVLACEAIGLILGGLVMLRLRPARLLLTATLGILAAFPLLGALAVPLPLAAVAAFALLAGIGLETFGVLWDTTMQQEIPPDRLSRVYAYDAFGSIVLIPIGLAVAGPIAAAIGTSETLWLAFAVNTAVTLPVLAVADVRHLRRRVAA